MFPIVFFFVCSIYIPTALYSYFIEKDIFLLVLFGSILLVLATLFYLILYKTKYQIRQSELICTFLFFKKRIPIESIRKIEKSNGVYAGWKMNTAGKCLVIHYNKYDALLISPEDQEGFIKYIEQVKELKKQTS